MTKELDNMTGEEIFAAADRLSYRNALSDVADYAEYIETVVAKIKSKAQEDVDISYDLENDPDCKSIPTIATSREAWCVLLRIRDIVKRLDDVANNYGLK